MEREGEDATNAHNGRVSVVSSWEISEISSRGRGGGIIGMYVVNTYNIIFVPCSRLLLVWVCVSVFVCEQYILLESWVLYVLYWLQILYAYWYDTFYITKAFAELAETYTYTKKGNLSLSLLLSPFSLSCSCPVWLRRLRWLHQAQQHLEQIKAAR